MNEKVYSILYKRKLMLESEQKDLYQFIPGYIIKGSYNDNES